MSRFPAADTATNEDVKLSVCVPFKQWRLEGSMNFLTTKAQCSMNYDLYSLEKELGSYVALIQLESAWVDIRMFTTRVSGHIGKQHRYESLGSLLPRLEV